MKNCLVLYRVVSAMIFHYFVVYSIQRTIVNGQNCMCLYLLCFLPGVVKSVFDIYLAQHLKEHLKTHRMDGLFRVQKY